MSLLNKAARFDQVAGWPENFRGCKSVLCRGLKFGKVDTEIVGNFLGNSKSSFFVEEIDCRFKRNHNRSTGRQMIQTISFQWRI